MKDSDVDPTETLTAAPFHSLPPSLSPSSSGVSECFWWGTVSEWLRAPFKRLKGWRTSMGSHPWRSSRCVCVYVVVFLVWVHLVLSCFHICVQPTYLELHRWFASTNLRLTLQFVSKSTCLWNFLIRTFLHPGSLVFFTGAHVKIMSAFFLFLQSNFLYNLISHPSLFSCQML